MAGQQPTETQARRETPLEGLASLLRTLTVALFVLTFIVQNFMIPSSSMASTLLAGDHVMVERGMLAPPAHWARFLPYREVRRGDIVVFYKPIEEATGEHIPLVKRVVAVPGDRIHLRNGIVYLNGVAQNEPYAARPDPAAYDPYINDFPSVAPLDKPGVTAEWSVLMPTFTHQDDLVVPPGKYLVMGDNRTHSLDSRYWGFVPRENIVGRPLLVYWSILTPETGIEEIPLTTQARTMAHEVLHFFDETRWSRTLHAVK